MRKSKIFGVIAIIAVIGFTIAACGDKSSGDPTGGPGDPTGDPTEPHIHTWSAWFDRSPATCTTARTEERNCPCGEIEIRGVGEPGDHNPGAPATCNLAQTCNGCGLVIVAALEHTYTNGICTRPLCFMIQMIPIPTGTFVMGPDEWGNGATYSTQLSAFRMSRYPVTQELYEMVVKHNPSYFNGQPGMGPDGTEVQGKRPVEGVTWRDAIDFCNKLSEREGLTPVYTTDWLFPGTYPIVYGTVTADFTKNGYRLPTEAQWEYACRTGEWGMEWWLNENIEIELAKYAWFKENSNNKTHQVGLKTGNTWGLYDMYGNVWEWCWDWHGNYPTGFVPNYTGADDGADRTYRGLGFDSSYVHYSSVNRGHTFAGIRDSNLGIRVVRP